MTKLLGIGGKKYQFYVKAGRGSSGVAFDVALCFASDCKMAWHYASLFGACYEVYWGE